MRRIIYVSGTRADFGLMRLTLEMLHNSSDFDLSVAATGMHLSPDFGQTINEIHDAGFRIAGEIPVPLSPATGATMARNIGAMTTAFTDIFVAEQPDIVLLLGDRGEMLAGAIAAIHLNIAVAHVHGGERSGTVDEAVRHAVSKLSHIHLVATEHSRQRLIAMGERPDCIECVGAPGLDGISEIALRSREEVMRGYGLDSSRPLALLVYHPVLQEASHSGEQVCSILESLRDKGCQILALMPNSDAGSEGVRSVLNDAADSADLYLATHLPRPAFLEAIAVADIMVGNSSSGIIEAASFGTPVINIGTRQNLRDRNANITDIPNDSAKIGEAISVALSGSRYPIANIYGDGHSAERIAEVLRTVPLDDALFNKVNTF